MTGHRDILGSMQYTCGHCGKPIFEASGFNSSEIHCQHCGALNIFLLSPIAIWHRPPLDREQCSAETCSSYSANRFRSDLSHLLELYQLRESPREGIGTSRR